MVGTVRLRLQFRVLIVAHPRTPKLMPGFGRQNKSKLDTKTKATGRVACFGKRNQLHFAISKLESNTVTAEPPHQEKTKTYFLQPKKTLDSDKNTPTLYAHPPPHAPAPKKRRRNKQGRRKTHTHTNTQTHRNKDWRCHQHPRPPS